MAEDGNQALQFERVEGAKPAAAASCAACQRTLPDIYFESAGKVFCAPCKETALASFQGGSGIARLLKSVLLGIVAAVVSAGIWYAIMKLTGYALGIVALAVGIAVGVAVRIGSEGRGGWAYQTIAVLLTYLAIGSSYVPLVMDQVREDAMKESTAEGDPDSGAEALSPEAREAGILAVSIAVGLALPVLQVMDGGFIGLLIVGFALYEAWKINKRQTLVFNGPFRLETASPPRVA